MRYRNQGLFSEHFLQTRLSDMPQWQSAHSDDELRQRLTRILDDARPGLSAANEPQTEHDLIRPLLEAMGLVFDVQTALAAWTGRRVADYAFFPSLEARAASTPLRGMNEFWNRVVAVADAKSWGTPLDGVGAGGRGRTPAQQLAEYMRDSASVWGVLSNGQVWRLYCQRPGKRSTDFFEINLEDALADEETFHLFRLVFGPAGFTPGPDGRTFNDRLIEESTTYAIGIGDRLRDRAFKTVELLAKGMAVHEGWDVPSQEQLDTLYENSLVLLYRLLFVLSAEARGLLPIDHPTYRSYSLLHLREEAHSRHTEGSLIEGSCELSGRMTNLFELIDKGDSSIGIPPYNGGLFDPEEHPFLKGTCCRDPQLAQALIQLTLDRDEEGNESWIDYRDIAPRHLGTIYEGLLEFRLAVTFQPFDVKKVSGVETLVPAKDEQTAVVGIHELILQNDKGERRASGSYYTPDYVVDYMVERALQPVLARIEARVEEEVASGALGSGDAPDGVERLTNELMSIRVLDPAMGSGHFLVAAMHYIANSIYTNPHYESPTEDPLGMLLRRRVAERCLFGVDSNNLAVELARLTLWLETVAPDRPLSFLDHHLRCGNSLMGADIGDVGQIKKASKGSVSLLEGKFHEALPGVMAQLVEVSARDAKTHADVVEKEQHARQAAEMLKPFREVADYWLAVSGFAREGDQQLLDDALQAVISDASTPLQDARWGSALAFGEESQFLHWQLEFPEAFFDVSGDSLPTPGFDCVIGNPPYEVLETRKSDFTLPTGEWTPGGEQRYERRRAEITLQRGYFRRGGFPAAASGDGKLDLYRLFIDRALALARDGGSVSMIVPRTLLGDKAARGVRQALWDQTLVHSIDAFPKDPPSCWVFPDAELAVVVFVAEKTPGDRRVSVRAHACREIDESIPFATIEADLAAALDSVNMAIPTMRPEDLSVIRKLQSKTDVVRFGAVAPCHIGEINSEYGQPYMRNEPADALLVRGRHVSRYLLDERTTIDTEKRWLDEGPYLKSLADPSSRPSAKRRIAKQAITDLNDPRRLIATICPAGHYLLDSCDYLIPAEPYSVEFTLAVLLSDVSEWRFRMTSSNNNVNAYEVDELPFPLIKDWSSPARHEVAERVLSTAETLLRVGKWKILTSVHSVLGEDGSRAGVHDATTTLVQRVAERRSQALTELDAFRLLLRSLPRGERLNDAFVAGRWLQLTETEFFSQAHAQGLRLTAAEIKRVNVERLQAATRIMPLVEYANAVDAALNEVVCALFELTPTEAETVSSGIPEYADLLLGLPPP